MKYVCMSLEDFRILLDLIKAANPPENMTKEEWLEKIKYTISTSHVKTSRLINQSLAFQRAEALFDREEKRIFKE